MNAPYVAIRRMSKKGVYVCVTGWLAAIAVCSPFAPSNAWHVLIAWGSIGVAILSPHIGLEIHTLRGMIRWFGLLVVWPWTWRVADDLFADRSQWANPPRSTV